MHYVCRNALRLSKCITSVEMHYVCQNALRLSKFCRNNYGYVNSDSAQLPYISAFYESNSRRSIYDAIDIIMNESAGISQQTPQIFLGDFNIISSSTRAGGGP